MNTRRIDERTMLPEAPEGYVWVIQTLRVADFTWFPWFTMGKLLIGLERDHPWGDPSISLFSSDKAHAFRNAKSVNAACNRVLRRRERRLKHGSAPFSLRVSAWFERDAMKAAEREELRSAKLSKRDANWVGAYPPRRLP